MKGCLSIEAIGINVEDALRNFDCIAKKLGVNLDSDQSIIPPFVGQVSSRNGVLQLSALRGRRDYSKANSKGSRGVYAHFILREDVLYYVAARLTWRSVDRYFCALRTDGSIYRLSPDEVQEWLRSL